jgi:hypothetical protein
MSSIHFLSWCGSGYGSLLLTIECCCGLSLGRQSSFLFREVKENVRANRARVNSVFLVQVRKNVGTHQHKYSPLDVRSNTRDGARQREVLSLRLKSK